MSQIPPAEPTSPRSPSSTRSQQPPYPGDLLQESDEGGDDLLRYFWAAWEHKWTIMTAVAVILTYGTAKFLSTPPRYQAQALMQLETRESGLAALQLFEEYDQLLGSSVPVVAEIEIMKSRTIMSAVADRLKLDIRAAPEHYPWIGEPIARHYSAAGVSKSWFGQDSYAWGGEQIEVQTLNVPDTWIGRPLTLITGQSGAYKVYDEEDNRLAEGVVGTRTEAPLGEDGRMMLFVSLLKARPGTRFRLRRVALAAVASELTGKFSAVEAPKSSGMLRLSLTAGDPEQAATTLNTVLEVYQRQNVDRKGAEADQTLDFIEKQLPPLKARLEAAETAYNAYLLDNGIHIFADTKIIPKICNNLISIR